MSLVNSLRSGVAWVSQQSTTARELVKFAKAQRLRLISRRDNAAFIESHPGMPLPPLDLMADAHAHTLYRQYYESGLEQARLYEKLFGRHFDFNQPTPVQIYEWGCGTGRLVRQLRELYPRGSVEIRGSDYNPRSVEWCKSSFPDIQFFWNDVAPPLDLDDNSVDIAYCSSVLTHLSDDLCRQWIAELARVVRPGGLISFTIASWHFAYRYNESERQDYLRGIPVYHEWDEVGRRDYFSWHPPQYIRRVFLAGLEEVELVPSDDAGLNKDVWLARVPLR